jgi:hypothetical protein
LARLAGRDRAEGEGAKAFGGRRPSGDVDVAQPTEALVFGEYLGGASAIEVCDRVHHDLIEEQAFDAAFLHCDLALFEAAARCCAAARFGRALNRREALANLIARDVVTRGLGAAQLIEHGRLPSDLPACAARTAARIGRASAAAAGRIDHRCAAHPACTTYAACTAHRACTTTATTRSADSSGNRQVDAPRLVLRLRTRAEQANSAPPNDDEYAGAKRHSSMNHYVMTRVLRNVTFLSHYESGTS